jgi:DNA polymerase III delta prime subunit
METNTKKKYNSFLWTEKFRPQKVKDIILPNSYKKTFSKYVEDKQIPNILLYSSTPGSGKTTTAKAICEDIGAQYIYINASSESGIDTLRDRITKFASTKSFDGSPKIVIMDEIDGAGKNLQQGLRGAMEEFHKVCRFIFTCNYVSQIIQPLRSRCQEFDMNMTDGKFVQEQKPKIINHIKKILAFEKIEAQESTIVKLVDVHYPDIRKIIQLSQQYSAINGCIDENIFNYEKIDNEFYQMILEKKVMKARKYLIEKSYNYDEMFTALFKEFVPMLPQQVQPPAIVLINDYQFKNSMVIDKEINFCALMIELMQIF